MVFTAGLARLRPMRSLRLPGRGPCFVTMPERAWGNFFLTDPRGARVGNRLQVRPLLTVAAWSVGAISAAGFAAAWVLAGLNGDLLDISSTAGPTPSAGSCSA
jgi:hypothetical protein